MRVLLRVAHPPEEISTTIAAMPRAGEIVRVQPPREECGEDVEGSHGRMRGCHYLKPCPTHDSGESAPPDRRFAVDSVEWLAGAPEYSNQAIVYCAVVR